MQTKTKGRTFHKPAPKAPIEPELLRAPEVLALTGIGSASQLQRMRNEGTFPAPVKIGLREIAWRRRDIMRWIDALPAV